MVGRNTATSDNKGKTFVHHIGLSDSFLCVETVLVSYLSGLRAGVGFMRWSQIGDEADDTGTTMTIVS